jgi:hypothetical protein
MAINEVNPQLPAAAARRVFSAGGRDYQWSDVVDFARVRGDWAVLGRQVCRGDEAGTGVSLDDWRRARKLLTRDETMAWLHRWGIELADVRAYLDHEGVESAADLERITWVASVCSADLGRFARTLAAAVALADVPPPPEAELTTTLLAELNAEFEQRRAALAPDCAVAELIGKRDEEWTSVEALQLRFDDVDAAREAGLCVRHDGMSLADVAAVSALKVAEIGGLLDDLDEPVRGVLARAIPGELAGPLTAGDGYQLLQLAAKRPPTVNDPVVVERARTLAVSRAIDRAMGQRILWHDRL